MQLRSHLQRAALAILPSFFSLPNAGRRSEKKLFFCLLMLLYGVQTLARVCLLPRSRSTAMENIDNFY